MPHVVINLLKGERKQELVCELVVNGLKAIQQHENTAAGYQQAIFMTSENNQKG